MKTDSTTSASTSIHYEIHGTGVPLFLGFPIMASHADIFGSEGAAVLNGYLERLTDRYCVLLADYPSIGKSPSIPAAEFSVERVCTDLIEVADAAGFDRFAYWGYSWGGAVGLQLATRTDRLSALVCGGWSPLGGQYADLLNGARLQVSDPPTHAMAVLRDPEQYAQWITFYESLEGWSEEAVAGISCPRMVFSGSHGDTDVGEIDVPIASTIRSRRAELEASGWHVREIAGRDFSVCLDPAAVVPIVREFLDSVI